MLSIRTHSKWLSAAVVVALAACAQPADQTQEPAVDLAAEAQAVEAVSMQWLDAAKAHDVDAATALIAQDAVFFDQGEGSVEGLPAIRTDMETNFAEYPEATIDWSTSSVQVASSGDMAWERGSWTFDPDGAGEAAEMTGEYVTVYKKVDGAWKVASDIGVTHEAEMEEESAEAEPEME